MIRLTNTIRDVMGATVVMNTRINNYGPSRFDPILPKLSRVWWVGLTPVFDKVPLDGLKVKWSVYADNAIPQVGTHTVADFPVVKKVDEQ